MPQQDADGNAGKAIRHLHALENHPSAEVAKFLRRFLEIAYRKQADRAHLLRFPARNGVARQGNDVVVDTKEWVMKVFLDAEENYSVSGYNKRAHECFGEIYLGLDRGPEYDRQSTKVNEAIRRITAEEAFAFAMKETREVLAANPGIGDADVSVIVLASICRVWFDLPDASHIVEGGLRFDDFNPPPCCPGDFMFPSAYIFFPEPDDFFSEAGPACGSILRQAMLNYVADMRASNRLPSGVLSRAVFEAFPNGDDDLVARTIIGVMMGMLPTVFFSLGYILDQWRADDGQIFADLQEALRRHGRGNDPYGRASAVLKEPMMRAMQNNPMPPIVWRTAVRDHTLGPISVNRGDKIDIRIASATREDLGDGITDVFPVFGGDRAATPHPTHACPAYKAAIGIMLGVINGLMEPT